MGMYIGVDIGGTKTLVAVLNEQGQIKEEVKFPTPKKYSNFILELRNTVTHLKTKDFKAGGVAVPGLLDRKHGRAIKLGNLGWKNVPVQADIEKIAKCPVVIENDANLAALSESMLVPKAESILYLTISTGIGTGVTRNQQLDPGLLDIEGGQLLLPHKGKLAVWESFASGHAIVEHFGKQAADIPASDVGTWNKIARNLAVGIYQLVAIVQPDLVVIGGSVGNYFDRYDALLKQALKKYELPVVPIPPIARAKRPNEAVLFGCYDLAKQVYGRAKPN